MICPFCKNQMYREATLFVGDENSYYYNSCTSIMCMINNDFPRYKVLVDRDENIKAQEYCLDKFYVKVSPERTLIYGMISYLLKDEIKIDRAIWLNPINLDQTLDTLKTMVIMS